MPWFRANFHCHSTNSDGDAGPEETARIYRSFGMDVVTLSDHNTLTHPDEYRAALGSDAIALPCSEYTGPKSAHVLGVDVDDAVAPSREQADVDVIGILRDGVDRVRAAGGVAVLCHPCWNWTWDHDALMALPDVTHFEVFNAAPDCNSYPTFGRSAPEVIWDRVLSTGRLVYGVATDDAHYYHAHGRDGKPPRKLSPPGLGYCVIDAPELSRRAVRDAFEAGRFYASTGVELADYRVGPDAIHVRVAPWSHERATIEFIGIDGTLLARHDGLSADYRFTGVERYVRARITDTTGGYAFTQPVML